MRSFRPHIPAAIRLGLTWGAVWLGFGLLLARAPGFYSDLPFAIWFAPLGVVMGILCSGLVQIFDGRRGFEGMSLPRSLGWGAASGLLLSGLFAVGAALRGAAPWGEFLLFGPALATAGAACAGGSVLVTKWLAERERRVQ